MYNYGILSGLPPQNSCCSLLLTHYPLWCTDQVKKFECACVLLDESFRLHPALSHLNKVIFSPIRAPDTIHLTVQSLAWVSVEVLQVLSRLFLRRPAAWFHVLIRSHKHVLIVSCVTVHVKKWSVEKQAWQWDSICSYLWFSFTLIFLC